MITHDLLSIGLLIVGAKLAEGVFGRIGISSLVAYAAAGILLVPVLGLVEVTDNILIFLEIGIFVFFFLVGLDEIDIPGLSSHHPGTPFRGCHVGFGHIHCGVHGSNVRHTG